jgi:hypothetical protein
MKTCYSVQYNISVLIVLHVFYLSTDVWSPWCWYMKDWNMLVIKCANCKITRWYCDSAGYDIITVFIK